MLGSLTATAADELGEARRALRAARYDRALALLEGCGDWPAARAEPAVLLRAEVLGRRDPIGALTWLTGLEDLFESEPARFAYALAAGKAYAGVHDLASARVRYAAAAKMAPRVAGGPALLSYHTARLRWLERDHAPGAPDVALALTHPDPSIAAAAHAVRGWLHGGRGDYPAQIADFERALAFAREPAGDEPVDVATLAVTCHALARVGFETADASALECARRAFDALAWTPDVAVERYTALRVLGWDDFMRGRFDRARWAFKDALALAPSPAWQVMAHLDRSQVAGLARDDARAIEELAEADRLAQQVRWESTRGEERQALVALAVQHAPIDAVRAQRYAALYACLGTTNLEPTVALAGDRRTLAFARYAQGRIDQALGRRSVASAMLREAYAIFDEAGHHYRAMLAAVGLAELTGDEGWRLRAQAHARRYPGCPLISLVDDAAAREEAMPRQLTPLQRQIARALWSGAEAPELAERFGRGAQATEREIAAVFGAFGVGSRAGLLDEARKRGLA
jgi:tetratricopeptide (TPR) repeat protein